VLKKMINGSIYQAPPTILNPECLPKVHVAMKKSGFGVKKAIEFDPKL